MRILIFYIFLFPASVLAGNTFFYFPPGDSGSVEFVGIKESPKLSKFELFKRVSDYIATQSDIESIVYSDSLDWITLTSRTTVQNFLVGKVGNPDGVIDYSLKIEFKDNKYRYSFNRLFYTPMKRNRYGIFKELRSKKKAVNTTNYKPTKSLWKKLYKYMSGYSFDYISSMHNYLIRKQEKEKQVDSKW